MSPVIFYTLDPRRRRRAPVLPRPAGPQQRHRRAAAARRCSSTSTCTRQFFTYQNMAYGATLAWLLFVDHARDHAGPVPDVAALGLLRGGALMAVAGRRRRPRHDRAGGAGVAAEAARRGAVVRSSRSSSSWSWPRSCRRSCARLVVSLQDAASRSAETDTPAVLPAVPRTFDYKGETYDLYMVPIDGVDPRAGARQAGPDAEPVHRPGERRGAARSRGTARGGRSTRSWSFSPAWQNYVDVWNLIDFPRLLFNTIALAVIGMIGTVVSCTLVAYGFARFRFPGRVAPVHAADRDDLPALRGDAHPDVHDLREARLGRDLAAAPRPDVLRQRLRRVPAPPVPADDPARDGRGGRDRRRRPVPDADLGDPARRRGR